MNVISEQELLGTVLKLLSKNQCMTIGQIRNSTRSFCKRRRIPVRAVFEAVEKFVDSGLLKRTVNEHGRVAYSSCIQEVLARGSDTGKDSRESREKAVILGINAPTLPTGELERLKQAALLTGKAMSARRELNKTLADQYTPAPVRPPASEPEARKEYDKAQRAKHALDVQNALEADPLAGLDDPEVNDGV